MAGKWSLVRKVMKAYCDTHIKESDLISRREVLEALTVTEEMGTAELLWLLTTRINDLPTVEAIPIRYARMLSDEDGNIQCSECGSGECWGNYCMNCGAKMENNNV